MTINQDPQVKVKFQSYPAKAKKKLKNLRKLIIETAKEIGSISKMEETLKWGEPSYLVKKGTTIRIDWKSKSPDQYAMYLNCQSSLVPTYKMLFGDLFKYEKNRAILFDIDEEIPRDELKECIELALTYHLVKGKPMLGK